MKKILETPNLLTCLQALYVWTLRAHNSGQHVKEISFNSVQMKKML